MLLSFCHGNIARITVKFRGKEKIFLFHQGKGKKLMAKEWFTVKECLELPGFPGSAPAVRLRLNTYSEGKEGVKRKRIKSKAEEFHISVFPLYLRSYLNEQEKTIAPEDNALQEAEPKEIWEMMFRLLTPGQRKGVTRLFGAKGIGAVFPFLFEDDSQD